MGPAAAIGGSAVLGMAGSYMGARAQRQAGHEAASAERYAADQNAQIQRYMYDTTRSDLQPYMDTGRQANTSMADLMGMNGTDAQTKAQAGFRSDPGYQFAFGQGQQALERSAAGKGGLYSGRAGTALVNYGQGMADQQYGNYYNRLMGMSTAGQNSAARVGSSGMQAAGAMGSGYMNAAKGIGQAAMYGGNAQAGMYQDFGNQINSGLNNYYYADKMGYLNSPNQVITNTPKYDWTTYSGGYGKTL